MSNNTLDNPQMLNPVECPQCGFLDHGLYCSHCGSALLKQRMSLSSLIASIIDFFYDIEDKYVKTFMALFFQPFEFIKRYINGEREAYYIPFKYFFFNLSLSVFIFNYFNIEQLSSAVTESDWASDFQFKSDQVFDYLIDNYGQFFSLIVIPLYVMASKLLFRKSDYNAAEISTAITFLLGQFMVFQLLLNLITAFFNPFYLIEKYAILALELGIVVGMNYKFFNAKRWEGIWKGALILILVYYGMKYILSTVHIFLDFIYLE